MNDEQNISTKVRISTWLKESLLTLILIASLIAFAFKEVIQLAPNEDFNWIKTVTSGIITYMFATYIYLLLGKLGRQKGKQNDAYKNTLIDLSIIKKAISDIVDKLPIYVAYKNNQAIKEVRINILSEAAMIYEKFKNGFYKEHYDELLPIEKQAYDLASTVKIETLSSRDLLCESALKEKLALSKKAKYSIKYNPLKMGRSEAQYISARFVTRLGSKMIYPIIFGYLGIQSIVWNNLLYGAIQSILVLLGGMMNYINNEDFVMTELRNRFIAKADYLKEFNVMYRSNNQIFIEEINAN